MRTIVCVLACVLGSCAAPDSEVDDSEVLDDEVVEDEVEVAPPDDLPDQTTEYQGPIYIGYSYPGPHRSFCLPAYYPVPCRGYQEKWVLCYHYGQACRCNRQRDGRIAYHPSYSRYFYRDSDASGEWHSGGVKDCRD